MRVESWPAAVSLGAALGNVNKQPEEVMAPHRETGIKVREAELTGWPRGRAGKGPRAEAWRRCEDWWMPPPLTPDASLVRKSRSG